MDAQMDGQENDGTQTDAVFIHTSHFTLYGQRGFFIEGVGMRRGFN